MRFVGKTVVVTGAAGGIGRAVCLAFAREGAAIVLSDVDEPGLEEAASRVQEAGAAALAWASRSTSACSGSRSRLMAETPALRRPGAACVRTVTLLDTVSHDHPWPSETWRRDPPLAYPLVQQT